MWISCFEIHTNIIFAMKNSHYTIIFNSIEFEDGENRTPIMLAASLNKFKQLDILIKAYTSELKHYGSPKSIFPTFFIFPLCNSDMFPYFQLEVNHEDYYHKMISEFPTMHLLYIRTSHHEYCS